MISALLLKPTVSGKTIFVTAHGYKAVPRTEFVPTLGGDGSMHPVPVDYYEYQRVSSVTPVNVINKKGEMVDNKKGRSVSYRQYEAVL